MGAISFSLDTELIGALKRFVPLDVFVESGTFHGDTVASVLPLFDELISIELSEPLYQSCVERFHKIAKVRLIQRDSAIALREFRPNLQNRSVLYWLDAHWCVDCETAGERSQCPLLGELAAIGSLNLRSVVLIDDARLFLATPLLPHEVSQWPTFQEVLEGLRRISDQHVVMVINDVIAFFPQDAAPVMSEYARSWGTDWLRAAQSLAENTSLRKSMEEKEAVIQELNRALVSERSLPRMDGQQRVAELPEGQVHGVTSVTDQRVDLELLNRVLLKLDAVPVRALATGLGSSSATLEVPGAEGATISPKEQRQWSDLARMKSALDDSRAELARCRDRTTHLQSELAAKEAVIQSLNAAISAYRETYGVLPLGWLARILVRLVKRARMILKPRLGNLNQYTPRPLSLPRAAGLERRLRAPPLISLVTPSYNQGHFIERTICSVLDQDYPNLEYFIQDGGSKDETVEVLKRYEHRLTGWVSEQDDGQSQAINRGFTRTSGEIMGWLNSDDLLLPGSLARVADFFQRHPEVDVVYGDRLLIDENDMEIGRWILPKHDSAVLSWADYIPQETLFWRRSIWHKVGGAIDESFRFAMDWDLIVRFRNTGAQIVHIPAFLGAFRVHAEQKTSSIINEVGLREMDRLRLRELGHTPTWSEVRMALGPYLARHVILDLRYRLAARVSSDRSYRERQTS
jgi:GT2 family glycosyltransferase